MARSYTITQSGESRSYSIDDGVGAPGSDASVTTANVRAAVPNLVEVASPANDDMIQRVGGSWVTRTIAQVRTALGLGSAAYTASTDYATAAQGILADSAIQEEDLAAVATSGNYSDLSGTPDLSNLQDQPLVVAVSQPAFNGAVYHNVASATYTDPSPVEGKGFDVLVINGTATVGGTGYGTAGTLIKRRWHSGAWQTNYVYLNKAQMDSLYLSNAAAGKTTPVDADSVGIVDSAASNAPKLLTFANLWVWIQSKFSGASSKTTPIDADSFNIVDSADSNLAKRVTGTNLKAYLKTYFDTLYGLLGGNNTWSGTNAFSSTTRPTSSGTGYPTSNNLVTKTDVSMMPLINPLQYKVYDSRSNLDMFAENGGGGYIIAGGTPDYTLFYADPSAAQNDWFRYWIGGANNVDQNSWWAFQSEWEVFIYAVPLVLNKTGTRIQYAICPINPANGTLDDPALSGVAIEHYIDSGTQYVRLVRKLTAAGSVDYSTAVEIGSIGRNVVCWLKCNTDGSLELRVDDATSYISGLPTRPASADVIPSSSDHLTTYS